MKKNLNLLIILLAFISCKKQDSDTAQNQGSTSISDANTSRGASNVYLSVQFMDALEDSITSDGLGLYSDGELGVRAELQSTNGDLFMMTNTLTAKAAKRFFKFPGNEDLEGKHDYRIRIKDDNNLVDIQTMKEGYSESMYMHLWSFDRNANKLFDIVFNSTEHVGSNYVWVKRTDPNTWEVVPDGTALAAIIRPNESKIESFPFKIILRRKSK